MPHLESLIPTIRKLQDIYATLSEQDKIELPQIVVVGTQSAGKSSVIEGIVGMDFLPRGTGIVTRSPLLLHLIHTPIEHPERGQPDQRIAGAFAKFEHLPGEIFTDFDQVRKEIQKRTNVLSGTEKGICEVPINLKIYSNKVIDLSLVDLPGMTKNPVGDQPKDIEEQIEKLIMKYIKNPDSLILTVAAANQDIATVEAIKFAQKVDRDGDRTLCVVTKLDLMDKGTNAMDVLNGLVVPVKKGIIGVVNRSQADIKDEKPMKKCLDDETKFLGKKYPTIAEKHGIKYLSKALNDLLMKHIQERLPKLKERIANLKIMYEEKLRSWGDPINDANGKNKVVSEVITKFREKYVFSIKGKGTSKKNITTELYGGACISRIFHETFFNDVGKINPIEGLTDEAIMIESRNVSGVRPALFIVDECFDNIVIKQVQRLEEPCLRCVDSVYEELLQIIQCCCKEINVLQRFPLLSAHLNKFVANLVSNRIHATKEFVKNLIKIEAAYINTKNPDLDLHLLSQKLADKDDKAKSSNSGVVEIPLTLKQVLSERDQENTALMKVCIEQYFKSVIKSTQDKVPKAIMEFMVNNVIENLDTELMTAFYKCQEVYELLVENSDMIKRRENATEMLKKHIKANEIINEIYETSA